MVGVVCNMVKWLQKRRLFVLVVVFFVMGESRLEWAQENVSFCFLLLLNADKRLTRRCFVGVQYETSEINFYSRVTMQQISLGNIRKDGRE